MLAPITYPQPNKPGGRQTKEATGEYLTVTFTMPKHLVEDFRRRVRRGDRSGFMALALECALQDRVRNR